MVSTLFKLGQRFYYRCDLGTVPWPLLEWGHEMPRVLNGLSSVHAGLPELVRAIVRCGHLIGDTIVQGSATSHMVPVEKGEGESVWTKTHTDLS